MKCETITEHKLPCRRPAEWVVSAVTGWGELVARHLCRTHEHSYRRNGWLVGTSVALTSTPLPTYAPDVPGEAQIFGPRPE